MKQFSGKVRSLPRQLESRMPTTGIYIIFLVHKSHCHTEIDRENKRIETKVEE